MFRLRQYCMLANLQLTVSSSVFYRVFMHFFLSILFSLIVLIYCSQFCSHLLFSILFSLIALNSVLTYCSQFCSHLLFSILFPFIVLNSVLTCIGEGLHSESSENIPIDMRNEKDSEECALPSRKRKKTNEKETGQNIFEIKLFGTIKINFFLSERFHKEL